MKVKVWNEQVIIPTYEIGAEEKNPIFLEKRVYQGSSGAVYPYAVVEKIEDEKRDKKYNACFIENEYIKVMVLPELGGRIQMAYDKIKERHFVYYNNVIKPALVGLTGPWISGGIEFNWPQHHRPSTYLPIDWKIDENEDGSATIWVNEQERMFHQKSSIKFTLYPGKAYIEIEGCAQNPTAMPQTFLWWANPAVCVNDEYQSVFPPDVNAVFDHGKRDVSSFPIATGTYYKVDYAPGTDISKYKNIPVPTSYMAIQSKYDFVGGYENDSQAGVLHVANHHISTGKKQWTWGHGDFGQAWDRNLTDEDGPYIELMTGMYCDNQPDFTWLQPLEKKTFKQYFLPYRELGVVKNASKDILISIKDGGLKIFATSKIGAVLVKTNNGEFNVELSPEDVVTIDGDFSDVSIFRDGKEVLSWDAKGDQNKPIPEAAKAALRPEEIETTEQLFLTGLHLEQYRHATYNPEIYYREALKRDPSDVRNNNALGLWLIRKGRFDKAIDYLQRAIDTQLDKNPNPYDGEPHYNLGLAYKYLGESDKAYDAFYKSCWNSAWQDSGYYALAQISSIRGNYEEALEETQKSLYRNWTSDRTRALRAALLRRIGCPTVKEFIAESMKMDSFNFGCLVISYLLGDTTKEQIQSIMRADSHNYREIALDFIGAGLFDEAVTVLSMTPLPHPLTYYYLAYSQAQNGVEYKTTLEQAANADSYCCFPNRLEDVMILDWAMSENIKDGKAPYYLGNLYYAYRQYDMAVELWEKSIKIDDSFPTVLRNLSLAYYNKLDKKLEAVTLLERAFMLDTSDARVLMELDQLYKKMNRPHKARLEFLLNHRQTAILRDDIYLEIATLYNNLAEYEKAKEMIDSRKFHPWEGGEGKVPAQYQFCRMGLAKNAIQNKEYTKAIALIDECYYYPHNLGEGKLPGTAENDFDYFKGVALEGLGKNEQAKIYFEKASKGNSEPTAALYYNDQKPDKIFYQGLAFEKLGKIDEAKARFEKLINYADNNINKSVVMDYFAVSLPDLLIWEESLDRQNRIHCLYMKGLGLLGLGEKSEAAKYLYEAASMDINHQGVRAVFDMIENRYAMAASN